MTGDSWADRSDRDLGMDCRIPRRDFLNGMALAIGGLALPDWFSSLDLSGQAPEQAAYYPPALTGMRGNHDGAFAHAHALRDHAFWTSAGAPKPTGERYDLVVVGAGLSGLAAAHFYRQQVGARARVLILDNHDDFGGHAKRNEFQVGGRTMLGYGGTQSIESPAKYSSVAKRLLVELGVETKRFYQAYDQALYSSLNLGTGVFFDRETFGTDRLVAGMGSPSWPAFLAKAPLSVAARRDISRVYTENVDYLAGRSRAAKRALLAKTSYADFLTKIVKLDPAVLPFFQTRTNDLWGVGIEAVPALACFEQGDDYGNPLPGFEAMGLREGETGGKEEPYIFHFPDGNASLARLLVRRLLPEAIPGHTMEDIVTARADYGRLDDSRSAVRIRLNSTVVRVRHTGPAKDGVEVAYMRGGVLQTVRGAGCILACYNGMIPHLCPELPEPQRNALAYGVKTPLIYTHVALRNWSAFQRLGVNQIIAPGSYHPYVALDFPVSLGGYKFPSRPEEPMVLFLLRTPCKPGLSQREQHRAGRAELLETNFATFERNIRDQLARMLIPAGFDPARDIEAITVNRWAHGYSYSYNSLFDPEWPKPERPHIVGRQRFGRIAIANADAGASAYTDVAINQAHRAVGELVSARK